MKIGLLIVFRNAETIINVQRFITLFTDQNMFDICLVNNGSSDKTMELLLLIKQAVDTPISVIDAQKSRGHNAAVKIGVHYFTAKETISSVLCLQKFCVKDIELLETVFYHVASQQNLSFIISKRTKRMIHTNVFSLRGAMKSLVGEMANANASK